MVEVLGCSTLLLPSSFIYYCISVVTLCYSSLKNRYMCEDTFQGSCCACALIFCFVWKLPACTGLFLISALCFGSWKCRTYTGEKKCKYIYTNSFSIWFDPYEEGNIKVSYGSVFFKRSGKNVLNQVGFCSWWGLLFLLCFDVDNIGELLIR